MALLRLLRILGLVGFFLFIFSVAAMAHSYVHGAQRRTLQSLVEVSAPYLNRRNCDRQEALLGM